MHRVVEAIVDEHGRVHLLEPATASGRRRALVVILDEAPSPFGTIPPAAAAPPPTLDCSGPPAADGETDPYVHRTSERRPRATTFNRAPTPGPGGEATRAEASRYRLIRPLGRGGMGETFLAVDQWNGRHVCVKQLLPGNRDGLLAHEWKSLARAASPYVVQFLDQVEVDGRMLLVMEFVDGCTLAERWAAGGGGPGDLRWLGMCLFSGLADVHRHGVIHCDLKPQNILVQERTYFEGGDPGWIPKIVDFGLAVLDRSDADGCLTAEGRVAGTPAYMAPEQVRGWMLSPACDVYSAGLVLWECCTGRRAFDGRVNAIMTEKLSRVEPLQLPTAMAIDTTLRATVEACTHPDPRHRPAARDAAEVFAAAFRVG